MNDSRSLQYITDVRKRLARLGSLPDGILADMRTPFHRAVILKKMNQIRLFFISPASVSADFAMSGAMSRLNINEPLNLLAVYTQAAMLALAWKPDPERICLLGLGGGRMAMALHYYFPDTLIDCVEIDPAVVDISETFFGLLPDDNLRIHVQDAREYMETLPDAVRYDIVLVDCFTGPGHHPGKLATLEFYKACRRHVNTGGVTVANILESDPLFQRKASTFAFAFPYPYRFNHEDADVFFGCDTDSFVRADLPTCSKEIENRHEFAFPFAEHARNVHVMMKSDGMSEFPDIIRDDMLVLPR